MFYNWYKQDLFSFGCWMLNKLDKKILYLDDVKKIKPNLDALKVLNFESAEKIEAIPFDIDKKNIYILTTNNHPSLISVLEEKLRSKWYNIEFFYTDNQAFAYALKWYDKLKELEKKKKEERKKILFARWKVAEQLIKKLYKEKDKYTEGEFLEKLIKLAFQSGASDLHFQPEKDGIVLRLRRDWILKEILRFSHKEFKKYLIKLKFMSKVRLNIDYLPQDWRFDFQVIDEDGNTKTIDVRVNFMPWLRGESIVLRFLDATKWVMSFTQIWFMEENLDVLLKNLSKNFWMILVTWPTWSWKTTTLYSILSYLNDPWKKIITLEDPVEYELSWIQQSQINPKKWYTYEEGLKSILRQDPDIIMIWEIRTKETAEIAINAALTGHLVLSTLHTNTAIDAIDRLLNMWVKPYMLAPALNLIISQRLLRRLHNCKTWKQANQAEKTEIFEVVNNINNIRRQNKVKFDGKIPIPVGCEECWFDGYLGRIAAIEALDINQDIRKLINQWKTSVDVYAIARQYWFLTLREDAYLKMLKWLTSLDEIRRVI